MKKILFLTIISLGILISGFLIAASFLTVTDTFNDESKIASKVNLVVSGGQVKIAICKDAGCSCSSDAGCSSGICGTDTDGDNYFSQSASHTGICQANSKPYTDCCDSDAGSYPGVAGYHNNANACGGWDWDCNGQVTKDSNACYSCSSCSNSGSCSNTACGTYPSTLVYDCTTEKTCGTTFTQTYCEWRTGYRDELTGVCKSDSHVVQVFSGSGSTSYCSGFDFAWFGITGTYSPTRSITCGCY